MVRVSLEYGIRCFSVNLDASMSHQADFGALEILRGNPTGQVLRRGLMTFRSPME
jgi:hypothetical protein